MHPTELVAWAHPEEVSIPKIAVRNIRDEVCFPLLDLATVLVTGFYASGPA